MSDKPARNEPAILVAAEKPALIDGIAQKVQVLVRVQAPDPLAGTTRPRRPYHLALVLDRSGSMSGEPLREAVRCARHIVDRMEPSDRAALVVFDNDVNTVVPLSPVDDRQALHTALGYVHSGGSTNLHGGWRSGAAELSPAAGEAAIARVILLSDGNANVGEVRVEAIAAACALAAGSAVSTSTYGLGRSFNEDLMVEMARRGGGNHYYGNTAADLFEPFAEEFDLIANLYARGVRLSFGAPDGVRVRVVNDYPIEPGEGFPVVRLPDIPWGAEAWVLLELEVPAALADGAATLLQVGATATTPDGEPIAFADASLALPTLPPQAWEATLADPLVAARSAELAAGRMLADARAAAERGDWGAIGRLLAEARRRFADFPWLIEVLAEMDELARQMDGARFSKEALYFAEKSGKRLAAKDEMQYDAACEDAGARYLRRRPAQGRSGPRSPG